MENSTQITDELFNNTTIPQQEQKQTDANALMPSADAKLTQLIDPDEVMRFGLRLKSYITANRLSVNIQGREYAMTDGWKYAGMNFGIVPMVDKPIRLHNGEQLYIHRKSQRDRYGKQYLGVSLITKNKEAHLESKDEAEATLVKDYYAYECTCKLVSIQTGKEVGTGHAICTNAESKKLDFDEYAVASMAQTRAIGKAFRNMLGYVMNAAGYETTPAEEMDEETYHNNPKQTNKATQQSLETIFDLLENKSVDPELRQQIEETMHQYTEDKAQKCISYLKQTIQQKGGEA